MKIYKLFIGLIFLSINYTAQINLTNLAATTNIPNGTAFIDASSYYHQAVSGSNDIGKGLVFPQVDLVNFQFNVTQPDGATLLPTWYDGMVVYNKSTGTTLTTGNRSSTALAVTPGFYYFSNPNGESAGNVTGGKWIRMGSDASGVKPWVLGGNSAITAPTYNATTYAMTGGEFLGTTTNQNVVIASNNVARLEIGDKTGVPVDGTNFNFVLDVFGKARFRQGIVTEKSTYPDYVFDNYFKGSSKINSSYKFLTLAETEKFIRENNHLPGVTKIDKLEKDGDKYLVDAAELSVQNLEKVEELYLHTIEQQKQINELKAQVAELKALLLKK